MEERIFEREEREGKYPRIECEETREGGRRQAVLIFRREELLYDIRNYCFIEGHLLTEDNGERRHTVQDVGEEGNVDRVTRLLDLAHADIRERLYPFTEREIRSAVIADRLRERAVYGIVLNVPEEFSQTTLTLLGRLIHELLVCTAVADWMSITNPAKEETWLRKREGLLARIAEVRARRRGRVRLRGHWI